MAAGLTQIRIEHEPDATDLLNGCCVADEDDEDCCSCSVPSELPDGLVTSITVSARRP